MAALTAVRLHKNVARGGGAARGRQSTRAYCGSERIAEPRRRRIGAAGRAALAGGGFSRGGRGEFGAWSVSPSAVPRVSEEASRSAFRLREPCAGPNVCGVQCDRDRGAVGLPPFFFKT